MYISLIRKIKHFKNMSICVVRKKIQLLYNSFVLILFDILLLLLFWIRLFIKIGNMICLPWLKLWGEKYTRNQIHLPILYLLFILNLIFKRPRNILQKSENVSKKISFCNHYSLALSKIVISYITKYIAESMKKFRLLPSVKWLEKQKNKHNYGS